MIYDAFLFHGEFDLLEIRLNILDKVVDKFVICEPQQSFSGEACPAFYKENKERFKQWEDKIIYYPFNIMEDAEIVEQARTSPNTGGNPYWMKVYYCMEMMRKPLEVCNDEDVVFISDLDEIWNPNIEIVKDDIVHGCEQSVYYYQLNNRCDAPWTGSVYTSSKRLKSEPINNFKQKGEVKIPNAGWHFSYQGGAEEVRRKVESSRSTFADNTDSYYGVPTEYIVQRMQENKDVFPDGFIGRTMLFRTDESGLPDYILENKEKYAHMLR